jgi:glycolate oxidase FAD binding subunit
MQAFGPVALLEEEPSRALWRSVRQVKPFTGDAARVRPLWRISTAPGKGHEVAALVTPAAQMFYDWAGGLVWAAMPFADEPDAGSIRGAVAALGGHATLIRASAAIRASVDVFEPEAAGLRALNKRVKEGFDPKGVLNPGRMWAGV